MVSVMFDVENKKVTCQIDNHDVVLRVLGDAQRSIGSLMHLCIEKHCGMFYVFICNVR